MFIRRRGLRGVRLFSGRGRRELRRAPGSATRCLRMLSAPRASRPHIVSNDRTRRARRHLVTSPSPRRVRQWNNLGALACPPAPEQGGMQWDVLALGREAPRPPGSASFAKASMLCDVQAATQGSGAPGDSKRGMISRAVNLALLKLFPLFFPLHSCVLLEFIPCKIQWQNWGRGWKS